MPHGSAGGGSVPRAAYSLRRTSAGRTRAAVQPGPAAMRLARMSVTGMVSSTSTAGTSAVLPTPAEFANDYREELKTMLEDAQQAIAVASMNPAPSATKYLR